MIHLLFALLLAFTSTQTDCAAVQALVGGEPLAWEGYENGGWTLPADIEMTARIDFEDGGLWEYQAESEPGTRWLWVFITYDQNADSNGEHFGAHEFCAVKIAH